MLLALRPQAAACAALGLVSSCLEGELDPSVSQGPWSRVLFDSHSGCEVSPSGPAQTRARQFLVVPRSLPDRWSECGPEAAAGQEMLLKT